jgi:tRNA(Arg) A34 adenosine deaminase TadA
MRHCRGNPFVERAVQEALKSTMDQKLGSVVVHANEIISMGHNRHCNTMSHLWSFHAEVAALMQLRKLPKNQLKECEMYVVRIGPPSSRCGMRLSKPCDHCAKYIEDMGIRRVFYTTDDTSDLEYEFDYPPITARSQRYRQRLRRNETSMSAKV